MNMTTVSALIIAATLFGASLSPAHAASGCDAIIDDISKAISGPVIMAGEKKASLMRMALSGYDHCMSGDAKGGEDIRDKVMKQLRASLGSDR